MEPSARINCNNVRNAAVVDLEIALVDRGAVHDAVAGNINVTAGNHGSVHCAAKHYNHLFGIAERH